MFGYYLQLALRSFARNRILTVLMVLAIGLGIGACMTTLAVFQILSGDPLPDRSATLFYPRMDPQNMRGFEPGEDPELQLTRYDAEALLRDARGTRQAMMTGGSVAIEPEKSGLSPFILDARYTSADFFSMFGVPMAHGQPWTAAEDGNRARVAVISEKLNGRLFDGADSVGRELRLGQNTFRIVGVMQKWEPVPRFYDLTGARFGEVEDVFLPFQTAMELRLGRSGNMNCWGDNDDSTAINAPCAWLQYWVQLDTPQAVSDYERYLRDYSDQQRSSGRFERPTNVRLHSLMGWMEERNVVPGDVKLQLWLALGFLVVCLVNTVGLLLAKFLRRSGEIGVRRALGASRREIFMQTLVEAGSIGLAGGLLGLLLAWGGLWAVRQQPTDYAHLAHVSPSILLFTLLLAIGSAVLAGLLPAWRACQVAPALQLKSQ